MNKCIFLGRLGSDVEIKATSNEGRSIGRVSIAVDEGFGDKRRTNWFNLTAFHTTADNMAKFFRKGSKVLVEARASERTWQDSDGSTRRRVEFVVDNFHFVDAKREDPSPYTEPQIKETPDDDVPF